MSTFTHYENLNEKVSDKNLTIAPSFQKRWDFSEESWNFLEKDVSKNYELAVILWNLMDGQNYTNRLNILPELFSDLTEDERKLFVAKLLENANEKYGIVQNVGDKKLTDKAKVMLMRYSSETMLRHAIIISDNSSNVNLLELGTQDFYVSIRAITAKRVPAYYGELCKILAQDDNDKVRRGYALNPDALPVLLAKLASDDNEEIVLRVVYNSNTSPETLSRLSVHTSIPVIVGVAQNVKTPKQILTKLAQHDEHIVRISAITTLYLKRKEDN